MWWEALQPVLVSAYIGAGLEREAAEQLAPRVREEFLDLRRWEVFEDAVPCLASLRESGWRHQILSNHVPELPELVEGLGLSSFFDRVLTSAHIGFEKPHPEAFKAALDGIPRKATVWMIGDNPVSDIEGATAAGLEAILVRRQAPEVQHCCETLSRIGEIVAVGKSRI